MFFSELTGSTPGTSYYTNQLKAIEEVKIKAKVASEQNLYPPKSNQATTVLVTLDKGADVKKAVELFLSLPQVETAAPNGIKTVQSISSETSQDPYERAKHEIIVQYKEGTTPEDVAHAVDEKAKVASQPLIGRARIAAENATNIILGNQTPEEVQEQYATVKSETGTVMSDNLLETSKRPTPLENAQVVTIENPSELSSALSSYTALPTVEFAVPNGVKTSIDTPNDPGFSQQWDMPRIQAPEAWSIAKGSDSVKVAVIDSGVDYNHQDLAQHVIKGKDFFNNDDDPMDDCGHGTHVAGTVGAVTNNGIGVAGVNWNVKILAVKALGVYGAQCAGNDSGIIQAIHYAADNGAKVMNLSIGGNSPCGAYQEAMTYAKNAGVTVIVAAGNSNTDASSSSPANCSDVMTVGARGLSDARASYSNYGSLVVISAPGGDAPPCTSANCIYSTWPNNQYKAISGTSMAAPHVAGAAGLLLSVDPSLSPDRVKSILISTSDTIAADRNIGPRLNLLKAVQAVGGGSGITPSPSPTPGGPTATPTPTGGAQPTPTGTPQPPTPTPTPVGSLLISVNIPGIGPGENLNPQPFTRNATVDFIGQNGTSVGQKKIKMTFQNNVFSGTVPLDGIAAGTYQIKVTVEYTLARIIRGFYTITPATTSITLPTVTLTSGDINHDGILDILDYNILVGDIQNGSAQPGSDLNNDAAVDARDLNIFLRQLGNRIGD